MINLDKITIEIQCPQCDFYNYIYLKQVELEDICICRGCKQLLQLNDYMHEIKKTIQEIETSLNQLHILF